MEEAIYHRVPLLGLPVSGDQPKNSAKITELGIGISLNIKDMTKSEFIESIIEIITDDR